MNLYLISQDIVGGYDTFDSAVVAAESPDDARKIHPGSYYITHISDGQWMGTFSGGPNTGKEYINETSDWVRYCDINFIKVEYLGKTTIDRGVVLTSFNAG